MSRRPYVREETFRWIFRHPRYLRYMAREFSCLFIGAWTLVAVVGLGRLSEGQVAWEAFLASLRSPASLVFHFVGLGFALYHSITWFNLTPKALPMQVGEGFVPNAVIAGAHYLAWAIVSIGLLHFAGVL
ncbi:MAG: fumarate reductase subunit C [Betaproteobacteria bacterium]|nr:fumarate reductase subunit C [Betaproteobacteria bacterium]